MDGNTREDGLTEDQVEEQDAGASDQSGDGQEAATESATGDEVLGSAHGDDDKHAEVAGAAPGEREPEGEAPHNDPSSDPDWDTKDDPAAVMTDEDQLLDQLRKLASGEITREAAREWLEDQYPE